MAYVTAAELRSAIGFQAEAMESNYEYGELTGTAAFTAMLTAVIAETTSLIDAMISAKYDIATVEANAILKRICLVISRYDVYTRFARFDVPETVRLDKDAAMKDLEKIQQGKLELVADDEEFEEGQLDSEFESSDQVFTVSL
jgi:phage gp36-like protein